MHWREENSTRLCATTLAGLIAIGAGGVKTDSVHAAELAKGRESGSEAEAQSPPTSDQAQRKQAASADSAREGTKRRLDEERRRLSEEAATTGNDPTAIVGYYQASYGHSQYTGGLSTNFAQAQVRLPLTPNWFVQFTLPYLWADLNRDAASFSANGTGNMTVRTGGRIYRDEYVQLAVGLDATFPTASDSRLGSSQYTLGPGVAAAVPLPRVQSLAYLVVSDYNSVGGDPKLAEIHFMQIEPRLNTYWTEHWWTLLDGRWLMDWNNRRKTTLNLIGVLGYRFDEHWNVFAGAAGGLVGQDTFLGLDWGVQLGVRWVFDAPLIPEKLFSAPFGNP